MKQITVATIFGAIILTSAYAQSSEVGKRQENQQDRISQGVQSGSLTAGETANLEQKEAAINQEVRSDRKLNGGHLTQQERRIINGQQNQMSRQIYQDKHNTAVQRYGNNEVDSRRENQQDRIGQGVASGSLTAGQAARLEKGEAAINQETRVDRKLNGGHLTNAEKAQINRQQNGMSRRIYKAKHS